MKKNVTFQSQHKDNTNSLYFYVFCKKNIFNYENYNP